MKKLITLFVGLSLLAFVINACKKDVKDTAAASQEISQEILSKIKSLGFSTQNVQKVDEGYLVEGDIILTESDLVSRPSSPSLLIAEEEQYHTNNLVTSLPRTITVSVSSGINSGFSTAIDAALARYNALGLQITLQRVSSGGDIHIKVINNGSYIASAGFPSGGDPYGEIKYVKRYTTYSSGFMTTVVAHEIGHCIGFRHTDYMNRAYSCGGFPYSEGSAGVGAVHIAGTPTGPDSGSWMLACLSATTNRPFNNNDRTALNYLY